ncbi:MAG: tRNA-dihydrouridine synthase [Spirochaetales bacterium]|nr:tRNA-dihydrouridine synthase [Spirochaetales bacterium]
MSFWSTLPPAFRVLAPMEDVTDKVFRRLVADHGEPDVLYTEFTSAEYLCSSQPEKALVRLEIYEKELGRRPLVAQIWGGNPEQMYRAARLVAERGFAGVDINMGCPVKKISRKGACSALIRMPSVALELIQAVKEGARSVSPQIGISVKTRIGWSKVETQEWCGLLLEQQLDALTVHGRIAKQMSEGWADWQEIAKVVQLRNASGWSTRIIGNGDLTWPQLEPRLQETGVDGLMIGRGVFSDIGIFRREGYRPYDTWSREEKLNLLERHIRDHFEAWGQTKDYEKLKKFFKVYTSGWEGALDLRAQLMSTHRHEESLAVLASYRAFAP